MRKGLRRLCVLLRGVACLGLHAVSDSAKAIARDRHPRGQSRWFFAEGAEVLTVTHW